MVVYYIQCSGSGLIKIGASADLCGRLAQMQSGSPHELMILATEPGGFDVERARHAQFSASRVRGEWFQDSELLRGHILAHCMPAETRSRSSKKMGGLSDDQIASAVGCSRTYVTLMRLGRKPISLEFAVNLYAKTGSQIGPIASATQHELSVLMRFVLADAYVEAAK